MLMGPGTSFAMACCIISLTNPEREAGMMTSAIRLSATSPPHLLRSRAYSIQPTGACGVRRTITVFAEYVQGLRDLDGVSHIIVLYHLQRITGYEGMVRPCLTPGS